MTIPARERLKDVVHTWIRDDAPLTVRMGIYPKHVDALLDKIIAAFPEIGEDYKFKVGDYVRKPKGYYYEGWVIGHCHTRAGELRYLVESPWRQVYIFNEEQLEAYTPETETVASLKAQLDKVREALNYIIETADFNQYDLGVFMASTGHSVGADTYKCMGCDTEWHVLWPHKQPTEFPHADNCKYLSARRAAAAMEGK